MTQPSDKPQDTKQPQPGENGGPVRSLAVGEAPGEDLGYDPALIPSEPIEPED